MKRIVYVGILFTFLLSLVSCRKEKEPKGKWDDTIHSGIINIACDENFRALMDAEIGVFEGHNPLAVIFPIYTNENEAIRLLTEDSVRFALTTRDLYPEERQALHARTMDAKRYLIAFDGIALIINSTNTDSILSVSALKKMLTGEITEWTQMNPQSLLGSVRLIVDNKDSGILRYLVDSIAGKQALTDQIYAMNNPAEVIEKVKQMPNTIGFVGINKLEDIPLADKNKIRLVRLSTVEPATLANSYLPYAGDIHREDYPLWRPVYVLLSDPKSGLSTGLSVFLSLQIGQIVLMKEGLLPVTDPQNRRINRIN
ncbi:MAG: Phosphate-binding protein PstS [Candidatus Ordinivivax streblomastigis]|uniref:Phosphate-binding protein PstS n=1 Tax=Candidatus Ordinivivax streblomastigis TaxID=2540710 RepID=A0A5M8NT53_9BACT|nr:MAG: Phosphate-binding protein PstS [Candidatus Ordinivivax streblomastigis]